MAARPEGDLLGVLAAGRQTQCLELGVDRRETVFPVALEELLDAELGDSVDLVGNLVEERIEFFFEVIRAVQVTDLGDLALHVAREAVAERRAFLFEELLELLLGGVVSDFEVVAERLDLLGADSTDLVGLSEELLLRQLLAVAPARRERERPGYHHRNCSSHPVHPSGSAALYPYRRISGPAG